MKKLLFVVLLLWGAPVSAQQATIATPAPSATGQAATGQIPGTATNDSAAAGNVGEFISSNVASGNAVSITTGGATDITSISLTAGDWQVYGNVAFLVAGGGNPTLLAGWIATTSGAVPTSPNFGAKFLIQDGGITVNAGQSFNVGQMRMSLSAPTTVYLGGTAAFLVGTVGGYGFIGARRVR